jgi:hypothetical protein
MSRTTLTIGRREFLIGASSTIGTMLLGGLAKPTQLFAQACNQSIPSPSAAPYAYLQEPKLLALRADCLLQQISNGYGYYGQPRNWTTLWSLNELSGAVDKILNNEKSVADGLTSLVCASDKMISDVASYNQAITAAQQIQASILRDIQSDNNLATSLLSVISELATDIATQENIVNTAQAHFRKAAMDAASGGCGLGQVLGIVAAVIAVAGAAVTAGTSLVAAYGAVGTLVTTGISAGAAGATALQELQNAYNSVKPIVTKIETASKDVNDLVAKYKSLQSDLSSNPDSARIAVEQSDFNSLSAERIANFDKSVNGTAGVSQDIKDQLIQAVHKYYDLVRLRNQKISDHDGLVLNIQDSARSYYEQAVQISGLSDMRSRFVSSQEIPQKLAYVAYLNKIQDAQLKAMRQIVWDEKRAQAFWQLNLGILSNTELVHINSMNTAVDLLQAHNGILTQQAQYVTGQQPIVTPFDPSGIAVILPLSRTDQKSFSSTRRFRFTVSPGDGRYPSHMKEIFVTGFKIDMSPTSLAFSGRLVHFGKHLFETISGDTVEFTSQPTYIGIQTGQSATFIDIVGTGTSQQIHGLSAFGDWAILADPNISTELLAGLTKITITFNGNSRASTQSS